MRLRGAPVTEQVDDAAELVDALGLPWTGLLWATAAPLRLAQAHLAARLLELGGEARAYGDHLRQLALATALAFLLSLWGRAVFARACNLRLRSLTEPGTAALRVPVAGLVTYAYAALALEALSFASAPALVTVPALALAAGLVAATSPLVERPGPWRPFALMAASAGRATPLLGLGLLFVAAALLAAANLWMLAQVGLWLAGGVAGLDLSRWQGLLGAGNPRALLLAAAGGWLLVEPWWLATLAVHVHKARSRASGEDLRLWFERLRKAAA